MRKGLSRSKVHRRHDTGGRARRARLALVHVETPPRAGRGRPRAEDTHQQKRPATTAVQVTQQEWRCLVCPALSCRQQHTQARYAARKTRFRPRQTAATSPRNSSDCGGRGLVSAPAPWGGGGSGGALAPELPGGGGCRNQDELSALL